MIIIRRPAKTSPDLRDKRIFRLNDNTQSLKTCSDLGRKYSVVLGRKHCLKRKVMQFTN